MRTTVHLRDHLVQMQMPLSKEFLLQVCFSRNSFPKFHFIHFNRMCIGLFYVKWQYTQEVVPFQHV